MATNDAPVLRQNVRWGEEYVSRGLNVKLAGVIKPGVYHGFVLKPGGTMAVLVDHEPDYPRSVAVVERDGYSLTVVMDDPGRVYIPATGTWFVCIEAHYSPTQQGYQRIVVREKPEAHHIVLGKVRAGVPLIEPGEIEPGSNDEESEVPSSAPGEAVVITQEMISAGEPKVDADNATLDDLTASIKAHDESVAAHGFDDPKSPLRKAIAAEATAAVNEKIGIEEGQINLLAHALTHAQDGVDPITPESIGAASENDPRITSAITTSRLGRGLHMEEVGEGDDSQTLLAADIATQKAPGLMQPDGVTTTVDGEGLLSAIGGNLLANDEVWITESGEWESPVTGWVQLLLIGGGKGSRAWRSGSRAILEAGPSGNWIRGAMYLTAGHKYPVTVGAGGISVVGNITSGVGGITTFGDLTTEIDGPASDRRVTNSPVYDTSNNIIWCPGSGPGGLAAVDGSSTAFYGVGGSGIVTSGTGTAGIDVKPGGQGAIHILLHNPAKAAGPLPEPALFAARRMAARAMDAPATVNLYDPETGHGSVWREEDAEARLAEGLITEEAWLEICAQKAAEERAAWLADPDTEAERFEMLRQSRDAKLAEHDVQVVQLQRQARAGADVANDLAAWDAYAVALCDLPAQEGAPWDGGGELTPWPEEPTVEKVLEADDARAES